MKLSSRRRIVWLALAAAGCLAVVLVLLEKPDRRPPPPDLLIIGQPQMTNGAMPITIVLSNGTPNTLEITDDGAGFPVVVVDDGTGRGIKVVDPESFDAYRTGLTNLPPLTNFGPGAVRAMTLRLFHTPPRFQLVARATDNAWIRRRLPAENLKYWIARAMMRGPTPPNFGLWARSGWITDSGASNITQTVGGISNAERRTPNGRGRGDRSKVQGLQPEW